MSSEILPVDWGNWALGDLPILLTRAASILGCSPVITSATVTPPTEVHLLPHVELVTTSNEELDRLRLEVEACEFEPEFAPESGDEWWSCLVAGLQITAETESAS